MLWVSRAIIYPSFTCDQVEQVNVWNLLIKVRDVRKLIGRKYCPFTIELSMFTIVSSYNSASFGSWHLGLSRCLSCKKQELTLTNSLVQSPNMLMRKFIYLIMSQNNNYHIFHRSSVTLGSCRKSHRALALI